MPLNIEDLDLTPEEAQRLSASMATSNATEQAPIEIPDVPDPGNAAPQGIPQPQNATEMIRSLYQDPKVLEKLREDATSDTPWIANVLAFFPRLQGAAAMMANNAAKKKANALGQLENLQQQENFEKNLALQEAAGKRAQAEADRAASLFSKKETEESLANDPEGILAQEATGTLQKLRPGLDLSRAGGIERAQIAEAAQKQYEADQQRKLQEQLANKRISAAGEIAQDRGDKELRTGVRLIKGQMLSSQKYKDAVKSANAGNLVNELLAANKGGNQVSAGMIKTKMAKLAGEVGALTERDVTRYATSPALGRQAADKFNAWTKGSFSDATARELQELVGIMSKKANSEMAESEDEFTNQASAIYGITPEAAREKFGLPPKMKQAESPVEGGIMIKTLKDGTKVKVKKNADGSYTEVK